MMTEGGCTASARDMQLHANVSQDLHTACRSLHIEADTIQYASCPKCGCLSPPKQSGNVTEWPTGCTWHSFVDSPPCGHGLVKSAVEAGKSVRAPICPFVVQNFDSFVGRLLCRPGYKKILDEGMVANPGHQRWFGHSGIEGA